MLDKGGGGTATERNPSTHPGYERGRNCGGRGGVLKKGKKKKAHEKNPFLWPRPGPEGKKKALELGERKKDSRL